MKVLSWPIKAKKSQTLRVSVNLSFPSPKSPNLASSEEIRRLLPSPPWFETFQAAFLWECMASGQSNSKGRENRFTSSTNKGTFKCSSSNPLQCIALSLSITREGGDLKKSSRNTQHNRNTKCLNRFV